MRLLSVSTYKLTEFFGDRIPPYAILSHTWGEDEALFQHVMLGIEECKKHKGWSKITSFCETAARDSWDWVWIDTCCIDKSSSTELSEAINSMSKWYAKSHVCFAYLADVTSSENMDDFEYQLRKSRWFTRGWTLQELLAPPEVIFFNSEWQDVGSRKGMAAMLSAVTWIDGECFNDNTAYRQRSIAQRMSWAAHRKTSREEDAAYCLLGLFDINMPLLYGEGPRAFRRLQLEIIRQSHDHSIFCWLPTTAEDISHDILADKPGRFYNSRHIEFLEQSGHQPRVRAVADDGYIFTNKGLRITLPVTKPAVLTYRGAKKIAYTALLNCVDTSTGSQLVMILARAMPEQTILGENRPDTLLMNVYRHTPSVHLTTSDLLKANLDWGIKDPSPDLSSFRHMTFLIQSPNQWNSEQLWFPKRRYLHAIRTPPVLGPPVQMYYP